MRNMQVHLSNVLATPKHAGGLRLNGVMKTSSYDRPIISIITVVFNAGTQLENTIKSVINQVYDNIEFIIIDGASTDNTLEIIKKYENNIDYWESVSDAGIYDAMNKGWALANINSKVLFLGAGDTIETLPIELIINNQFSETILYGDVDIEQGVFRSVVNWKLHIGNTIHHQALLVPKSLHVNPPFNIEYPVYADYDFNVKLYKNKHCFKYSKQFKSFAYQGGISSRSSHIEMVVISKKNFGLSWSALSLAYHLFLKIKELWSILLHRLCF